MMITEEIMINEKEEKEDERFENFEDLKRKKMVGIWRRTSFERFLLVLYFISCYCSSFSISLSLLSLLYKKKTHYYLDFFI